MSSKIYFIGDTHFGHRNIISYCNRPFADVEDMNKKMINLWNSTIKNRDEVFVVGDFALCGKDKIIEIGKKLNGRKRLILGNHDSASMKTYKEAGFDFVYNHPILLEGKYIVSHEPEDYDGDDFVNIFAHVHDDPAYEDVTHKSFCVSSERIGFKPIEFGEIKRRVGECWNG